MTPPPLLKPRHHGDGRLYTESEIIAADSDALHQIVGVCVMGWRWAITKSMQKASLQPAPRIGGDGPGWHPTNVPSNYEPHLWLPKGIEPFSEWWSGGLLHDENGRWVRGVRGCPDWPNDIAAAFDVDRPNWRWEMEDYDRGHFDVTVVDWAAAKSVIYEQHLGRKATPADYARARCVAALLLAAKIGE